VNRFNFLPQLRVVDAEPVLILSRVLLEAGLVNVDVVLLRRRRTDYSNGPMVWNSLPDDLRAQQDNESF